MRIAQEEVFGPVLAIVRVSNVDEAIAIENSSPYGNAASVYTENGGLARYVTERAGAASTVADARTVVIEGSARSCA